MSYSWYPLRRLLLYPLHIALIVMSFTRSLAINWKGAFPISRTALRPTHRWMSSSGGFSAVKRMSVTELGGILSSANRKKYQIVDVRERDELQEIALNGDDIVNLPLSDASSWTTQVLDGKVLDAKKPTLCICKMGGRSLKAATFFGKSASVKLNYVFGLVLLISLHCSCNSDASELPGCV